MLIVEGPDLVGKTTFCQACVKHPRMREAGYIYSHFTRLPPGFVSPEMYVDRMSRYVVQDRFHVSEPIYARLRGDESVFKPEHLAALKPHRLVIITADDCLIERRFKHLAEREMYDLEKILIANQSFIYLARNHQWRGYRIQPFIHIHCSDKTFHYPTADHVELVVNEELSKARSDVRNS